MSSDDNCSPIVIKLLTDCRLIERMISAFESNDDKTENQSRSHRPGYMGHLTIIGNQIRDKCQDSLLRRYLSEELYDKWKSFIDKVLIPINKTICSPLVNEMPQSVNMDDPSLRNQESALQQVTILLLDHQYCLSIVFYIFILSHMQAFIEYQMQQMTRNLCTQIAFAANEFNEVNESIP